MPTRPSCLPSAFRDPVVCSPQRTLGSVYHISGERGCFTRLRVGWEMKGSCPSAHVKPVSQLSDPSLELSGATNSRGLGGPESGVSGATMMLLLLGAGD